MKIATHLGIALVCAEALLVTAATAQPGAGACCLWDGTCVDGTTVPECAALAGVYQGDGTVCAPAPGGVVCPPPPTGANFFTDPAAFENALPPDKRAKASWNFKPNKLAPGVTVALDDPLNINTHFLDPDSPWFNPPPNNGACADRRPIFNGKTPFDNTLAILDGPTCDFNMDTDVWWNYTAAFTGDLTVDTCQDGPPATLTDTVLTVYNGCDCAALGCLPAGNELASDDDTCGVVGLSSTVTVPVVAGNCYKIQVGGWNGQTGSGIVTISKQPEVGACCLTDGSCVDGVDEATCAVLCGTFQGGGTDCLFPCPLNNNLCENRRPIFNGKTPFDNTGATTDGPICDVNMTGDLWWNYTATFTGKLQVDTCQGGTIDDTVLTVYDGCLLCPVDCATVLASNDDTVGCGPLGFFSSVSVNVVAGNCYKIQVGGWNGQTGTGVVEITKGQPDGAQNDLCAARRPIFNGKTPFTNVGATLDGPTCDFNIGSDVWWNSTAAFTGTLTVDTCQGGTLTDTVLTVYNGCDCAALGCIPFGNELASDDDTCGVNGFLSTVTVPVVQGNCYKIQVGGWNGRTGTGVITLTTPCDDPNSGDCCIENKTPGCDRKECCVAICAIDPFCCNNNWDALCAVEAAADPVNCPQCQPGIAGSRSDMGALRGQDGGISGGPGNTGVNLWPPSVDNVTFQSNVGPNPQPPVPNPRGIDGLLFGNNVFVYDNNLLVANTPADSFDILSGPPTGGQLPSGNCCFTHPGQGCEHGFCAVHVCEIDITCCVGGPWDAACVAIANAVPECDCNPIPPDNHTAMSIEIVTAASGPPPGPVLVTVYGKNDEVLGKVKVDIVVNPPPGGPIKKTFLGIIMTPGLTIGRVNLSDLGAGQEGISPITVYEDSPGITQTDIAGPLGPGFPDGCVDAFDLALLLNEWCSDAGDDPDPPGDVDPPCEGCASPFFTLVDINGPDGAPDGCVDAFDLAKLLNDWCSVAGSNPCGTCGP